MAGEMKTEMLTYPIKKKVTITGMTRLAAKSRYSSTYKTNRDRALITPFFNPAFAPECFSR